MKRLLSFALVLCILVILSPQQKAAYQVGDVIFSAYNDTLSSSTPLSDQNMPVMINLVIYVPYSDLWRMSLKASYNQSQRLVMIHNNDEYICFDLANDTAYNAKREKLSQTAIWRYNKAYVPITTVCEAFDFHFSPATSDLGMVLRVSKSRFAVSDQAFVSANENTMRRLLEAYEDAKSEQPGEPSGPGTIDNPNAGNTTPTPKNIYPLVEGALNEHTSSLLAALKDAEASATFFVPKQSMLDNPELLRAIFIQGHEIGISLPGEYADSDALLLEIGEANALLKDILRIKTRLLCVSAGSQALSEEQVLALTNGGYLLWDSTVDATDRQSASSMVSRTRTLLSRNRLSAVLLIKNDAMSVEALPQILRYIDNQKDVIYPIKYWDTAINAIGVL